MNALMNAATPIVLCPADLLSVDFMAEVVSAGGVAVLDCEYTADLAGRLRAWAEVLPGLIAAAPGRTVPVGIKCRGSQLSVVGPWLTQLGAQPLQVLLCQWSGLEATEVAALAMSHRPVLLELTDAAQLDAIQPYGGAVAGLVVKGHESGGWVGDDAAFLLTQKVLNRTELPVYVQGGIGPHTAAACRAAGAAGVVLDDQFWLMPQSPLPADWQRYLMALNGQEAILIGERLEAGVRVLSRPHFQPPKDLQARADQLEIQAEGATHWRRQADPRVGWGDPQTVAWPMGQTVGLAALLRDSFASVGDLIRAIAQHSQTLIETAQRIRPLAPDSPLAQAHRTRYPLVQGPMTRVSDTAEFAAAVTKEGALPLLALALMRGDKAHTLLQRTQALVGDRPWGIGILGFVPHAIREEQLKAVRAVKPPFALIAGGRPDQAAELEKEGINAYIHVPVPALLKLFLEQGGKRFVFEGRECGGHVGPISSFVLWEGAIYTLLRHTPPGKAADMHVLFAGGIHDELSALMISVLAAPLAAQGMKVGVLMGTAYLFTQEAVDCGAILPEFQQQILACDRTLNLETGPGHASRCAITPFAHEFYATRRRMMAEGQSFEAIKTTLEDLTLGRLRIASKGLTRDKASGQIVTIEASQQIQDGMYMIGQVATLRDRVATIADLHRAVSEVSTQRLAQVGAPVRGAEAQTAAQVATPKSPATTPSDIAIVGIGTLLPGAHDVGQYWQNILNKVDAVSEIPGHRWDWRLYYDADPKARDKIYSKWGGFIDAVPFDPLRFGIPPFSLKSIEPLQLLALEGVRRALADAGYEGGNFDRENTSVILGAGGGISDLGGQYATRSEIPRFVDQPDPAAWDRLPEWTEETFPGLLLNVAAGRVANRFDFGGSNFTVDAACASSLAAIDLAVRDLETGRSNICVAGGIDTGQSPFAYFCFSKTQALSARGRSRSFDQNADGIAISEGIAIVVLKRLAEAERDGDRIYAVIKGVAGSSDGKALGMTAPRPAGQARAFKRAYAKAGFSPSSLGLYEAHGTGTPAGDKAELETVTTVLTEAQTAPKACAVGSVKTMIGHTKSAAGVAGLIKAALALHHRVLPPHMGVDTPLAPILDPASPVYLPQTASPWLASPQRPRRAGVSAFGFGGTNFHAVLEEYAGPQPGSVIKDLGGPAWSHELVLLRAESQPALVAAAQALQQALAAGAAPVLADLAYSTALACQHHTGTWVLGLVVRDLSHLATTLEQALAHLAQPTAAPLPPHIVLGQGTAAGQKPVAFLFPGQGAQYVGMARQPALYFPELRAALETAEASLSPLMGTSLTQLMYPPSAYDDATYQQQKQALMGTEVAQPAIGTVEAGYLDLMARLGVRPAMTAGHSYGEYAALHGAGVLSREDFLRLSVARGQAMAAACQSGDGAMAAIQAPREHIGAYLASFPGGAPQEVIVANHNAPLQSVISGRRPLVQAIVEAYEKAGVMARMLPVAGAFHSALVGEAQASLNTAIQGCTLQVPQVPVYANATAQPYPQDPAAIAQQLGQHLLSPVEFVGQIEAMHDAGARLFLEVGPKSILTPLVGQILAERDHAAVALEGNGSGMQGVLAAIATLVAQGAGVDLPALYRDRTVAALPLDRLAEATQPPVLSATTWLVTGGNSRPHKAETAHMGQQPPLSLDTVGKVGGNGAKILSPTLETDHNGNGNGASSPSQGAATGSTNGSANGARSQGTVINGSKPNGSVNGAANGSKSGGSQVVSSPTVKVSTVKTTTVKTMTKPPQVTAVPSVAAHPVAVKPTSPQPRPAQSVASPVASKFLAMTQTPSPDSQANPALAAYQAYQETMRQFLLSQEQVMQQVLQQFPALPGAPVAPAIDAAPAWFQGMAQPTASGAMLDRPATQPAPPVTAPPAPAPPVAAVPAAPPVAQPVPAPPAPVAQPVAPPAPTPAAPAPVVAAAAPAPAPAAPAPASPDLLPTLVQLVSDRTGYPPEMLGVDQDLEAELGIDSIKRVEILGAFQKALPDDLGQQVQAQMETLTQVKTLSGIVEQLGGSAAPAPAVVPAAPAPVPAAPAPATNGSGDDFMQTLVQLVSDRTGYPPEMLGVDQDLEAELGIDSIKRVEILGAFQKALPDALGQQVQAQMETLTQVKTLRGIVEQVQASASAGEDGARLGKSTLPAAPSPAR